MYTSINFKTKKALKDAVEAWNKQEAADRAKEASCMVMTVSNMVKRVEPVTLYAPGLGEPKRDGIEFVSGPHFPQAHSWYAQVTMKDGKVIKVK